MKIVLDFVTNSSEDDYYYDEEEITPAPRRNGNRKFSSSTYENHCWRCGNPINGAWNKRCPRCKLYICPNCGACHCDY